MAWEFHDHFGHWVGVYTEFAEFAEFKYNSITGVKGTTLGSELKVIGGQGQGQGQRRLIIHLDLSLTLR